jgi:small subunit ribosomal protein S1
MLEENLSSRTPARLRDGQRVKGTIIQVGAEVAFVSLGGKGEGQIDLAEFRDAEGEVSLKPGDPIEAYVLSAGGPSGVMLSRGLKRGAADAIAEAAQTGVPVEGVVKAVNKGGLEVDLGGARGFCPMSQMDVRYVDDPAKFIGQRLTFRVVEVRGRDIVLSRRALLAEEARRVAAETRTRLETGAVFAGRVVSVREFGAFVDIGGIEGLLPNRELPRGRSLAVGDEVQVEVLQIKADARQRITLSARALESEDAAPASGSAALDLNQGAPDPHPRTILSHASDTPGGAAAAGASTAAPAGARIALPPPLVGAVVDATVDRVEPYGVFVKFTGGKGLVPAAELGVPHGADLRKQFPPGTQMRAAIIEIDPRGRYRLSAQEAERAAERADAEAYMKARAAPAGRGFGTLGDLLKPRK